MDEKNQKRRKVQVQRAFHFNRLGPECMSAAYETLVPILRVPLPDSRSQESHYKQEVSKWAM